MATASETEEQIDDEGEEIKECRIVKVRKF